MMDSVTRNQAAAKNRERATLDQTNFNLTLKLTLRYSRKTTKNINIIA